VILYVERVEKTINVLDIEVRYLSKLVG